eukprot:324411-Prorocentrum_lima.AAC.1
MTSSLVGSEMCIRDRIKALNALEIVLQSEVPVPIAGFFPTAAWWWLEPVSYTHLTLPTICSV